MALRTGSVTISPRLTARYESILPPSAVTVTVIG